MVQPDFAHMTIQQLVGYLARLAFSPLGVTGKFNLLTGCVAFITALNAQASDQPGDTAEISTLRLFIRSLDPQLNRLQMWGGGGVRMWLRGWMYPIALQYFYD